MKFGYIRVSTKEQNEERQIEELLKYKIDRKNIFIDKETGKTFQRKNYILLKNKLRFGDEIFFHELDRVGRTKKEMKDELQKKTS